MTNALELRERGADTEKITINLGYVDLGRVDLLVKDGFYSNRTDFIRTAIRNQLSVQADDLKGGIRRRKLDLGLLRYSKADLERIRAAGDMLDLHVVGLVSIAEDVPAELARATIGSVTVLGQLQASPAIRAALADRTH